MRDFDDNDFPLAYLITFRCYGTWLHGDDRASTDRKHNIYGTKKLSPNQRLQLSDESYLKNAPLGLNARQRSVVEGTIREVCTYRRYGLRAINVRTNHVHLVVSAASKPEPILNTFKIILDARASGCRVITAKYAGVGPDMEARSTFGRKMMWRAQLLTCCLVKGTNCSD